MPTPASSTINTTSASDDLLENGHCVSSLSRPTDGTIREPYHGAAASTRLAVRLRSCRVTGARIEAARQHASRCLLTGLADVRSAVSRAIAPAGRSVRPDLDGRLGGLLRADGGGREEDAPERRRCRSVVLSRGILMTATFVTLARLQGVPDHRAATRGCCCSAGCSGTAPSPATFWSVQHLPLGRRACFCNTAIPIFVAADRAVLPRVRRPGAGTGPSCWRRSVGVALIVGPRGSLRGPALIGTLPDRCSRGSPTWRCASSRRPSTS